MGVRATAVGYPVPDRLSATAAEAVCAQAVSAVVDALSPPQVIVLLGRTQAASELVVRIEEAWSAPVKPTYVLAHGVQVPELLQLVQERPELATRVVGTAPGAPVPQDFVARYRQQFDGGDPFLYGATQTYDAFYQFMYGFARMTDADFSAGTLVDALDGLRMPSGIGVEVGPDAIAETLEVLAADAVKLTGLSGSLNASGAHGVGAPVRVWCVDGGEGSPSFLESGILLPEGRTALEFAAANGRCPLPGLSP